MVEGILKSQTKHLTTLIAELCAQHDQRVATALAHAMPAAFHQQADASSTASGTAATIMGDVLLGDHETNSAAPPTFQSAATFFAPRPLPQMKGDRKIVKINSVFYVLTALKV